MRLEVKKVNKYNNNQLNGIIQSLVVNDYKNLKNLPTINGVQIVGDLTFEDIGISTIIPIKNFDNLPNIGASNNLYIDEEKGTLYRWDETNKKYYIIGFNYNDVKIIDVGHA